MGIPVLAICGIATDEWSWGGMPVDRIVVPRGSSIAAMAGAILAEAPDRFALCGHSMGGYVAFAIMRVAAQRVAGLALLSTSAKADTPEQREGRAAVIAEAGQGFAAVTDKLAAAMLSRASREVPGLLADTHAMLTRCGGTVFVEQQRATAARADASDLLGGIAVPTLVLSGDEDKIVAPERSQELAAAIPDARLVRVPACGHIPQREEQSRTCEALQRWIATVEKAA